MPFAWLASGAVGKMIGGGSENGWGQLPTGTNAVGRTVRVREGVFGPQAGGARDGRGGGRTC